MGECLRVTGLSEGSVFFLERYDTTLLRLLLCYGGYGVVACGYLYILIYILRILFEKARTIHFGVASSQWYQVGSGFGSIWNLQAASSSSAALSTPSQSFPSFRSIHQTKIHSPMPAQTCTISHWINWGHPSVSRLAPEPVAPPPPPKKHAVIGPGNSQSNPRNLPSDGGFLP